MIETDDRSELVGHLRDYVILALMVRKGLVTEVDIQEQIDIVRAQVPTDHPVYHYLMDQFDRMERTMPPSSHVSPIMNDPMVPLD